MDQKNLVLVSTIMENFFQPTIDTMMVDGTFKELLERSSDVRAYLRECQIDVEFTMVIAGERPPLIHFVGGGKLLLVVCPQTPRVG